MWNPFRKVLETNYSFEEKQAQKTPEFTIGPTDINPATFGVTSYTEPFALSQRVDRESALSVPAVKRGRDLIAGTLGSLPIDLLKDNVVLSNSDLARLLVQPENGIPRSVTMARTVEDLLFEGVAWWHVVETNYYGYPTRVVRLDPRSVDVGKDGKIYVTKSGHTGMTVEYASDWDLIRFDSPNAPLLTAGARAIRTSIALEAAAQRYANGNQPLDFFTTTDSFEPDQDELDEFMAAWNAARKINATGYVPYGFDYKNASWNPEQLQLAEARQHAALEIARVIGVDPEDLGVSTTSRTYQNSQDRYQSRIKDTLRGYYVAIEERLSMNDVLPRGYTAKFNFADLTRADDTTRLNAYKLGLETGVYADKNEVRTAEGKQAIELPQEVVSEDNVNVH